MEEKNIPTVYDPQSFEKWYKYWEDNKLFHAEVKMDKQPFSIVIPPPNVTGQLHMDLALDNKLQDIQIRWRRIRNITHYGCRGRSCGDCNPNKS